MPVLFSLIVLLFCKFSFCPLFHAYLCLFHSSVVGFTVYSLNLTSCSTFLLYIIGWYSLDKAFFDVLRFKKNPWNRSVVLISVTKLNSAWITANGRVIFYIYSLILSYICKIFPYYGCNRCIYCKLQSGVGWCVLCVLQMCIVSSRVRVYKISVFLLGLSTGCFKAC